MLSRIWFALTVFYHIVTCREFEHLILCLETEVYDLLKPLPATLSGGHEMKVIEYSYKMPPDVEVSGHIKVRTFYWQVNDGPVSKNEHTKPEESGTFNVPKGASFKHWTTQTDQAGNESPTSDESVVTNAADTIPPIAPAPATLSAGVEIEVPDPVAGGDPAVPGDTTPDSGGATK